MYRFSIIIPVFNAEKYLNDCFLSLKEQRESDYEIILVDDGSTDSSGIICDRYHDLYPDNVLVIHKKNEGQIAARMTGVEASRGDYICFVDADDTVEPNWLQEINTIINNNQSDIVIFGCNRIDEKGELLFDSDLVNITLEGSYSKEDIFKIVFSSSDLNSVCLKVCRKTLFQNYDSLIEFHHVRIGEDLLQTLPILYKGNSFYITNKKLYNYRVNGQSVTHKLVKRQYEYVTVVKPVVYEYMVKLRYDTALNKKLFYMCLLNELWRSLYSYYVLGNGEINKRELIGIANNKHVREARKYINNKGVSKKRKLGLWFFYTKNWFFLKYYFCLGEFFYSRKNKPNKQD